MYQDFNFIPDWHTLNKLRTFDLQMSHDSDSKFIQARQKEVDQGGRSMKFLFEKNYFRPRIISYNMISHNSYYVQLNSKLILPFGYEAFDIGADN